MKDVAGRERFLTIAATPVGGTATAAAAAPAKTSADPAPAADLGVIATLAFAFLGGLILNLMPCVFPILAMKAVGVARLAGHARGVVRARCTA